MTGRDFDHVFDAPQKPVLREFKEISRNEGEGFEAIHEAARETFRIVLERRRRAHPQVDKVNVLLDLLSMTVHASRKLEKRLSEAEATLKRTGQANASLIARIAALEAKPARLKSVA